MPLYVNDLLDDPKVVKMSLEEFGAYMKLLCYNWNRRGVPSDTRVLASMLRVNHRTFSRIWPTLSPLFPEINPGLLGNDRVMIELLSADEKAENYSKSAKERGTRSRILGVTDQIKADQNKTDPPAGAGAGVVTDGELKPKPDQKPKPDKPRRQRWNEIIAVYSDEWTKLHSLTGERPVIGGPDTNALGRIYDTHGIDETIELVKRFVCDPDAHITKRGHMLRDLPSRMNAYRAKPVNRTGAASKSNHREPMPHGAGDNGEF